MPLKQRFAIHFLGVVGGKMRLFKLCLVFLVVAPSLVAGSLPEIPLILSLRQRAALQDHWLSIRLDRLIPELMRAHKIDMWILVAREYNEDPVVKTMLPATWFSARRRTILIFSDRGEEGVERLAVSRYDIGDFFKKAWSKESQPNQWEALAELVKEHNPQTIAINTSSTFALADGMTASENEAMREALPKKFRNRLVSGEMLAVGWLETRIEEEMIVYPQIVQLAHAIIAEGFSEKVIQPGVTSTLDVQWWFRERISELKLETWFHPSVSLQRSDAPQREGFDKPASAMIIMPGDLIHVDFGITYLGLNTDTQQHAYVLRPGETDAPESLRKALAMGNRLQDILTEQFATGRSGNDILAQARKIAIEEGMQPSIYSHPLGYHGHGAGPAIGMWDQQQGVVGTGDYQMRANTAYSIELNVTLPMPEWGKDVRIMLEEDAFFDGKVVRYLNGRQTSLLLIPRLSY